MTMKEIATGLQHIGVPTGDMDATIHFYHALGFETIFETVNAEAGGRVNFFKLGDLVIETYEVTDPAKAQVLLTTSPSTLKTSRKLSVLSMKQG